MGFGARLSALWDGAQDSAKAAAKAVSDGTSAAWTATKQAAGWAGQKARDAATATAAAAGRTWQATQRGAARAWDATTDVAADAWDATKDAAVAVRNQAIAGALQVKSAVSATAQAAYRKAKEVFGPRLIGQPIEPCPTSVEGKRERAAERRLLIADVRREADTFPPDTRKGALATAARFERHIQAVEHARLSQNVYENGAPAPTGWQRLSNDPAELAKLGLKADDFAPSNCDFRAALYRSELTGETVLAFKGTTTREDWKANLDQGLGRETEYYTRAMTLAGLVSDAVPGPLSITGHSLGGGLASAASAVTGLPADTFNAAGLHPNTIARYNVSREQAGRRIEAYRVEGEILTAVQNARFQDAAVVGVGVATGSAALTGAYLGTRAGSGTPLAYDAIGTPHTLPAVDEQGRSWFVDAARPVDKHLMPRVINGLEKQKADDQYALKTTLGRQ